MDGSRARVAMTVLAIRDVKRPPPLLCVEQAHDSGRIIVDAEDEDAHPFSQNDNQRLLKLVLRDSNDSLAVAIEHERGSVPPRIGIGSRINLNYANVVLINHRLLFLKKGAVELSG